MTWTLRLTGAIAMVMCAITATASVTSDPFSACQEQFAKNPQDYDSAYCFYEVTFEQRLWADGARRFEALIARHPKNFWLPLAYGHVYRGRDPDRAEELYRLAANSFRDTGNSEGEIVARSNLRNFLFPKGRVKDAAGEMQRVVEIGAAAKDPILKVRAWTLEATHVQDTGGDLGHAFRLLKRAEDVIFPDGPYRLKRTTLLSLGQVAFRMGRLDEALSIFRKLDELAGAEGEGLVMANARYNILNTLALKESVLPTPGSRQRLMRLAEQSLTTGVAAQNRETTMKSHRAIAELLANSSESRAQALDHAERCVALAIQVRQPHDEAVCSWVKASLLREGAPEQARAAERRALDATARANSPRTHAYSAGRRMRLSWEAKSRSDAIRDSLDAIDAIETLRGLQDDSESSAELFSAWTSDYYWLSGRLVRDAQPEDLTLAFSITERMRARSLLDTVERARRRPDAGHPAVKERRELLDRIAAVQRRLMEPALDEHERRSIVASLRDLELQEHEARRQISLASGDRSRATPSFASLQSIQSTLAENEALLSFQVGLWDTYDGEFGGGSWLVAVTRHQQSVHRLPDRAALAAVVPVFTGLLNRPGSPVSEDGLETAAAARLYDDLLSEALTSLPAGIDRLILILDGPLHHLPFDALKARADATPLAARYQLTVAPSATLWHHWRKKSPQAAPRKALTLADPELSVSAEADAFERNAALTRGLRLGRLPHARRESRALERHLGEVDTLVGRGASERALKDHNLRGYSILHFAAHAIADEAFPERSAVLLSAGSETEDGLLQAREIEGLDLDGRIVVLSACQTASGTVLSGEGVLSLARAFFEAGAQSVIGSRWPIRDAEAASFFDAFYRILGEGASLSEALARAKGEAIAAGRPAAIWASLVLLGDGDFRPFPPAARPAPWMRWPTAALVLAVGVLLAFAVALAARRWKRGRESPDPFSF